MTLRIDAEARLLTISPAALLGGTARRIGFDRGEGFERLWIGQAVHRRVAAESVEQIPGYASEKSVRFTFPVDDYTVVFEGRVDGRYEEHDGCVVVDEIKSLHFAEDLAKLPGSPRMLRFQLQLGWYLHAVALSEGRSVAGRLILADIETGATRIVPVSYEPQAVQADLTRRVRALLQEFFGQEALAEAKSAEGESLVFPFPRWRPGQREMTAAVALAAEQGSHLLVEAPTGIGKTAAALYPLLRASLKQSKRLYVLTAKTTQQEIYTKTLDAIEGESFRSVRLRAKERMCANDVILCHEDHCRFAKDYGAKMEQSGLLDRLLEGERHLDPDRVFEKARREMVCPFAVSLELAERADVVIGDYNYIFDPVVALADAKDPGALADSFLLVDEAHNLIDRGRSTYSPELTHTALAALAAKIGVSAARSAMDAERALGQLMLLVSDSVAQLPEESGDAPGIVLLDERRLDDLRLDMESLLVRHLADMRTGGERVPDDPVLELYFTFARFHDVSRLAASGGEPNDAFDVIATPAGGGRLSILCKDPSQVLGPIVNGSAGMIGMSATLSPPEFHRDLIGLDRDRTDLLKLPSPFPRENRVVLVSPDIDTSWSARGPGAPKLAALVADVAKACPGNVLVLFPSYRFLDDVKRLLPPLPGRRIVRPSDRSNELERNAALDTLRDGGPPVLLFAVSGGAFAEGVDYPGEMLSAVVVVSPALPQVRFEQERMRLYFEERYEKGFEYAYVIPGMTRVVQSAGRLIRSESDVGVVVLACRRFLRNPYRRYLPEAWFDESADELSERNVGAATANFFDRVKRGELPLAEGGDFVPRRISS